MSVTLRSLGVTDGNGRPLFKLVEPYHYRLGPDCTVVVPAGYVTNFGTVPRWFYLVVSPVEMREAAIVHDYMTNEDFTDDNTSVYSGYSRWLADAVLYEALARQGFGFIRRLLVFAGVRFWAIVTGNTKWAIKPQEITLR